MKVRRNPKEGLYPREEYIPFLHTNIDLEMKRSAAEEPQSKRAKAATKVDIEEPLLHRCVDTIRVLSADIVEKANSGHPGAPMGCAPIAHVLFGETMVYSPSNPKWSNRDRFILSNGHACALLYSMLHLTGYDLSMDDLKSFRQFGSKTPGHPENFLTPGVEVSTGPLGQGISNAVGLAIAERHLAATFNRDQFDIVDHFTYVICGDGCLQEGVSSEACSLAGHLGLGKLIVCYDDNHVTIDGDTALSFTEDVNARFQSYGWHVLTVSDANDMNAMREAIRLAKAETERPSIIKIRTIIGQGSLKEGTGHVHGNPLGAADIAQVKQRYSFSPNESFEVPEEVRSFYQSRGAAGKAAEASWNQQFAEYKSAYPDLAAEFERRLNGELPKDWKDKLPKYSHTDGKSVATRNRSEEVLNAIASCMPEIMGGSADLTPSNLTSLKCSADFQKDTPAGRYIRFGVREHAMAAICNGMFAHGSFRPYCATFLNFIGYALGGVRLSALSRFGVIYVMTHDSIGLGEDGPTHQPIEMLESLRAMPNLLTIRPADGNETVGAYVAGIENSATPSVLSLSRHGVPTLEGSSAEKVLLGAYTLREFGNTEGAKPAIILVSSGTEVTISVDAAAKLHQTDNVYVRVVSMPCWELFEKQSQAYQLQVFPEGVPVMSVEASSVHGWRRWAHAPFGMNGYGASAPAPALFKHFGFTADSITEKAREVIKFYSATGAPSLISFPTWHAPSLH